MNAKLQETLLASLLSTMTNWPLGTVVWHRATGERMLVDGYRIYSGTLVTINVSDGKAGGHFNPFELSRCRPTEDVPGEEWKNTGLESS